MVAHQGSHRPGHRLPLQFAQLPTERLHSTRIYLAQVCRVEVVEPTVDQVTQPGVDLLPVGERFERCDQGRELGASGRLERRQGRRVAGKRQRTVDRRRYAFDGCDAADERR